MDLEIPLSSNASSLLANLPSGLFQAQKDREALKTKIIKCILLGLGPSFLEYGSYTEHDAGRVKSELLKSKVSDEDLNVCGFRARLLGGEGCSVKFVGQALKNFFNVKIFARQKYENHSRSREYQIDNRSWLNFSNLVSQYIELQEGVNKAVCFGCQPLKLASVHNEIMRTYTLP
jgi:hypothetical protein